MRIATRGSALALTQARWVADGLRLVSLAQEACARRGWPAADRLAIVRQDRVATFLLNLDGVPAAEAAVRLAERGYGVWAHDNWYSLGLYEGLGYENEAVRAGIIHYNTAEEVDGLLAELGALVP